MNLKYLFKIFLVFFLSLYSFIGLTQTPYYPTIIVLNQPLKDMFAQIEQQTPFSFVYSNSDIDVERKLTYKSTGKELFEILSEVFRVESIDFQVKGNHIVLTKLRVESQKIEPSRVTGTVLDAKEKLPIPGVNVIIKNTGFGTVTNELGQFSIQIPEEKCMLVFSFIGFTPQEIDAKDKSDVVIYLVESSQLLDEVVAYAYGNENKKMLSSAISSIKTDRITDFVTPAIIESLKGKITGIAVNKNSGTPGGAMTVRIRGISSITAGADPLYIIDGIPLIAQDLSLIIFSGQGVNTISDINPADIESVSILKDASATAIYGARGSNGVFLITTKRGKNQLPKVNFHLNMGLQEVAKTYKMLNAEQFMRYRNDAAINDGGTAVYTEEQIKNNPFDTDWQKELFRVSPIENYDLSINGGNENTTYYLSGNYFNQQGIAIGTDYKRYGARFNFDQVLGKGVTVGTSLALNKSVNNRKEGDQSLNSPVAMALSRYPIYPILNTDGTYNEDGPNANPISIANQHINVAYSWHALGNVFASFKFLDGLTYKIKYGFDFVNFREHTFDPPTTRQGAKYQGLGIESTSEVQKNVISNIITYNNVIDQKHIIDLLAGSEIESENRSSTYLRGELFPSNTLEYIISAAEKISADAFANEAVINSFFGRARYNFSRKYTTTFNARFDGSSRFSTQNRYGFFPSGDFLWRISDEDFFSFEKINDLKFRVSYGITGNDKIPDFLYITRYGTAQYDGLSAIYPINIANPNLKWETTKQFNIGFDIALWEGKLTTSIDYYHKKTEDLLLNKPTPPSSGYTGIIENIGKLENKGFELSINSKNISQTLNWQTFFNISFNRNKVTELYKNQPIDNIGRGSQRIAVGEPVGFFYGYKSLGVNPLTGDIIFEDLNRDGTIDVNDKEKIGSPHPLFDGGISNVFEYKNFEADVFFQFSYGNDIFNGTRRYIEIMRTNNQSTAVLDRWMKPGDITAIPRATNSDPNENNRVSSRFVEDGSYLKLKSIKLAYSLDSKIARRWSIPKLKLYLQAQNIITWTKFSGMDPEVNYAGPDVIRSGVEFFTYPSAKIYSFGLSMEF